MSDDLMDQARRAAILHTVAEAFKAEAAQGKTLALNAMGGRGRLHPTLPDGTEIASVTVPASYDKLVVTDERALLGWVEEGYPTEVQIVKVVRPAFLRLLGDLAKKAGEPVGPQGELNIPGLEVHTVEPSMATVKPTPAAREMAARLVERAVSDAINGVERAEIGGGS